jgi:hypothetical protein
MDPRAPQPLSAYRLGCRAPFIPLQAEPQPGTPEPSRPPRFQRGIDPLRPSPWLPLDFLTTRPPLRCVWVVRKSSEKKGEWDMEEEGEEGVGVGG